MKTHAEYNIFYLGYELFFLKAIIVLFILFLNAQVVFSIEPDSYETDDVYSSSNNLSVKSTQSHNFHVISDLDWFSFVSDKTGNYYIKIESSYSSIEYAIYDQEVNIIDSGAKQAGSSTITISTIYDDTYYLMLSTTDSNLEGLGYSIYRDNCLHSICAQPVYAIYYGHIVSSQNDEPIYSAAFLAENNSVAVDSTNSGYSGGYYLPLDKEEVANQTIDFSIVAEGYIPTYFSVQFDDLPESEYSDYVLVKETGNIDGNGFVNLTDLMIALKVLSGSTEQGLIRSDYATSFADVSGNNQVGMEEVEFVLQEVAGLR